MYLPAKERVARAGPSPTQRGVSLRGGPPAVRATVVAAALRRRREQAPAASRPSPHPTPPDKNHNRHTQQLHDELDQTADACNTTTRNEYAFLPGGGVRAINPGALLTVAQSDTCFVVCKG
jgi:hypothetical protein